MTLHAIVADVVPDAVAIARALAPRGGVAFLHRAGGRPQRMGWPCSYIAVEPAETVTSMLPPLSPLMGGASGDTRARAPLWIGVLPYECGRSIERAAWAPVCDLRPAPHVQAPAWRRYGAVVEVDAPRGSVRVIGEDPRQVRVLARALRRTMPSSPPRTATVEALRDDEPLEAHLARVRRAKELIAAGDLYQVNLARRMRFSVGGDALEIYASMARQTAPPFGAYLDWGTVQICGCSPELFLHVDPQRRVLTVPIKGTRPRGVDAESDRALAAELGESAKERAELAMILDVERNDLGRVAEIGSVRLLGPAAVETHPTLHHRGAAVQARLSKHATVLDLLRSAFPSGSVTGAPKVRAMEVIAALEPARRGLYTGAIGAVSHDGTLQLAMAIRVLTIADGEGHYYAGGGIVADSDPDAELKETFWKGVQVERLIAGLSRQP